MHIIINNILPFLANGIEYSGLTIDGIFCFSYMYTCDEKSNSIDLCSYQSFSACDSPEILPLYECNNVMIQCIEPNANKREIFASLTDNENVKPPANIYAVVIRGFNYQVLKNNSLSGNKIVFLDLTKNSIDKIEPAAFDSIVGLKTLKLVKNNLVTLSFGSHKKGIEALFLSYNKIRIITREMLTSLVELIFLELDENYIDFVEEDAFKGNKKLKKLTLKSNNLKSVGFKSESLIFLNLDRNKFQEIKTDNSFRGFNSLKLLSLSMNNITNIERNAFDGIAGSIVGISVMRNHLKEIKSEVFGNVTFRFLKILALATNELKSFKPMTFEKLVNLNTFILNFNKITDLEPNMFINMNSLEILYLNNLVLTDLDRESAVFRGLTKLKTLDLSNNSIVKVRDMVFNELTSLEILNLKSNLIDKLTKNTFDGLRKLKQLFLSINALNELTRNTFRSLESVEDLYIEDNSIDEIEADTFYGISKSLKNLIIPRNRLQFVKNFHFAALTELRSLNLASNQISSIQQGSFSNLRKLETLKLDMNSIFHLDPVLFMNLDKLRKLDLSYNLINKLEKEMFKYLNQLEELDLNDNIITVLKPHLFAYLSKLKVLRLARNLINNIDFSCFEKLDQLYMLQLSYVKKKVKIVSSQSAAFANLKMLDLEDASPQLIKQFNLSNLDSIKLDLSATDGSILKTISSRSINLLYLRNVQVKDGTVDDFLQTFGPNLTFLDLSGCAMKTEFDINLFNKSKNLTSLRLSNCTGCFNPAQLLNFMYYTNLTSLELSFNNIAGEIPIIFLLLLEKLEYLDLSHNNITKFPLYSLWSQTRLAHFDLSYNLIETVDDCVFERLEKISYLDLSFNKLSFLGYEAFCNNKLEKLSFLNLESNDLRSLDLASFSFYFYNINLKNNRINNTMVSYLANSPFVLTLDLGSNNFKEITKSHFELTYLIFELNLNENSIESIEDNSFEIMRNLLDLNIAFNNLSSLDRRTLYDLSSLQNLNLSHNKIETINSASLYRLKRLRTLDLSYNLIKSIANYTFNASMFLKTIRLERNPLENDFFTEEGLDGLFYLKFIFIGGQSFNFTYKIFNSIIKTIFTNITKQVLGIDLYDSVSFYVYGNETRNGSSLAYLEDTNNKFELCVGILYLLRNNIQFNMLYEKDVNVYLNQCSRIISKNYYLKINSTLLVESV
jgi:Leucine-rich repeat (LRR) protein